MHPLQACHALLAVHAACSIKAHKSLTTGSLLECITGMALLLPQIGGPSCRGMLKA